MRARFRLPDIREAAPKRLSIQVGPAVGVVVAQLLHVVHAQILVGQIGKQLLGLGFGLLFVLGSLIMAYNVIRTVSGGKAYEAPIPTGAAAHA